MNGRLKVFSGNSNPELAQEICGEMGTPLGDATIIKFSNDNIKVKINENVRGADVFVLQTSCPPVSDHFMELLILIDAIKHASADRITAVLPYYPYVRSDKKDEPRISITARLIADLLQTAGADRVLTINLHSPQIQGFFHVPVDQLLARNLICDYFKKHDLSGHVVVAPDAGSAKRAAQYANLLDLPIAILDKRRTDDSERPEVFNVIGTVKGKKAMIFDDEIATGGSMIEVVKALEYLGVKNIVAACVHAVLSGEASKRLKESSIAELIVTNTVPIPKEKRFRKMKILSVGQLIAEAIRRIHHGESVSDLFR